MESQEQELLTVIRTLRVTRHAKRKEEKKEEAHLEKLKFRLRIKLNDQTEPKRQTHRPNGLIQEFRTPYRGIPPALFIAPHEKTCDRGHRPIAGLASCSY
jgi:hypothetical protein